VAKTQYAGRTDGRTIDNDYHQFSYETYLLLQPNANIAGLPEKLKQIHLRNKATIPIYFTYCNHYPKCIVQADGTDGVLKR